MSMFNSFATAIAVYVARTSTSPSSCMLKPPHGCFIDIKKAYVESRSTAAYAAGVPIDNSDNVAEYVGAQCGSCPQHDSAVQTEERHRITFTLIEYTGVRVRTCPGPPPKPPDTLRHLVKKSAACCHRQTRTLTHKYNTILSTLTNHACLDFVCELSV